MSITIVSVPSKKYNAGTNTIPFTVGTGIQTMQVLLTRESWPAGLVISGDVVYPDGVTHSGVTLNGGTQFQRDGITVQTVSGWSIGGQFQDGVRQDLPAGQYVLTVQVMQTLNTAITVTEN